MSAGAPTPPSDLAKARRLFPWNETQAKVVTLMVAAAFVAAVGYLVLRGLGLTQLFGE